MILRFKSASSSPEYLGINTEAKTYATKPKVVNDGIHTVITVACNHFHHLMREIDFNSYGYTDDLTAPASDEDEGEVLPF